MQIDCKLSHAEMREAFRMNLTPAFWFRAALGNVRALVLIVVMLVAAGTKIAHGDTRHWESIVILLAIAAGLIALYVWRLSASMKKTANKINEACVRMNLDTQGMSTASSVGATTFTPWQQFSRWKEGKLVFTVGDKKAFRTIPKSALNGFQVDEVRGLLQSQVRSM